jgi:hypothetical protein
MRNVLSNYNPIYSLRIPSNKSQEPQCNAGSGQCYTVFEFIPANPSSCGVGRYNNLSPCQYADGTARFPYNEFNDEISAGAGSFNLRQYFDYGLPNQRLYGVKQIYRTLPDGFGRIIAGKGAKFRLESA